MVSINLEKHRYGLRETVSKHLKYVPSGMKRFQKNF